VLRRTFGPKKSEVARGWGKLHNEEFHNFYALPNIIRVFKLWMMRWVWLVVCIKYLWNAYKILIGKSEGKRTLGRSRLRVGSSGGLL